MLECQDPSSQYLIDEDDQLNVILSVLGPLSETEMSFLDCENKRKYLQSIQSA
jgi:hypothetical protein